MASTSGTNAASPPAHSSDASRRPRETCELAQGRLFRLAGAVREHLLARDELLCEAAKEGQRRGAESWEEDRVDPLPRPCSCPRLARQTLGLPLQRNNTQLKQQRGVRVPAPQAHRRGTASVV